jgi:hypothetical protein
MSPVPLKKFQMAPIIGFLISSESKKKEPVYICLSDAKALLPIYHNHCIGRNSNLDKPHRLNSTLWKTNPDCANLSR